MSLLQRYWPYFFLFGTLMLPAVRLKGDDNVGSTVANCGNIDSLARSQRDGNRPDAQAIAMLMRLSYLCKRPEVGAEAAAALRRHSHDNSWGEAIFRGAEAASAANDFGTAETLFDCIENNYRDQGALYANLGGLQLQTGRYGEAEQSYARAAKLDPGSPEMQLGLAGAHALSGHGELALAGLARSVEQFPADPRFLVAYADVLQQLPAYSDAVFQRRAETYLRRAISLDGASARAHYLLAQLLIARSRVDEAVRELETTLRYEPEFKEAHFALSRAYRRLGRKAEADQQYTVFRKLEETQASSAESREP